ncbi:MAG: hypothetical protein JWP79_679 [Polaromonas sp.]|jgi:hypothetical protein|nr:hypothetical protein [Polaromonas sp.]MDB5843369.1 hypothetical protein [Polaromonas sp.]
MTFLAFEPSLQAADERIRAVRPQEYARTRNALDGDRARAAAVDGAVAIAGWQIRAFSAEVSKAAFILRGEAKISGFSGKLGQ